jgi:hypothetical protein
VGQKVGRTLYQVGLREEEKREAKRRGERRRRVPRANTSFGAHIERVWRITPADERRSLIFRAALKMRCEEAMAWLAKGNVKKAKEALVASVLSSTG